MFFVLSRGWDKKKKSEFPEGIDPKTFGFRAPMLYHCATETLRWAISISYEVHMIRILHTARISHVDSIMFANYT